MKGNNTNVHQDNHWYTVQIRGLLQSLGKKNGGGGNADAEENVQEGP